MQKAGLLLSVTLLFACVSSSAVAADRGNNVPPSIDEAEFSPDGANTNSAGLIEGGHIDKTLYAQSEVIYHSAEQGTVTIRVDGQLLRLDERTLEIIDVLDDL